MTILAIIGIIIFCIVIFINCCIARVEDWEKIQEDIYQEEYCKKLHEKYKEGN